MSEVPAPPAAHPAPTAAPAPHPPTAVPPQRHADIHAPHIYSFFATVPTHIAHARINPASNRAELGGEDFHPWQHVMTPGFTPAYTKSEIIASVLAEKVFSNPDLKRFVDERSRGQVDWHADISPFIRKLSQAAVRAHTGTLNANSKWHAIIGMIPELSRRYDEATAFPPEIPEVVEPGTHGGHDGGHGPGGHEGGGGGTSGGPSGSGLPPININVNPTISPTISPNIAGRDQYFGGRGRNTRRTRRQGRGGRERPTRGRRRVEPEQRGPLFGPNAARQLSGNDLHDLLGYVPVARGDAPLSLEDAMRRVREAAEQAPLRMEPPARSPPQRGARPRAGFPRVSDRVVAAAGVPSPIAAVLGAFAFNPSMPPAPSSPQGGSRPGAIAPRAAGRPSRPLQANEPGIVDAEFRMEPGAAPLPAALPPVLIRLPPALPSRERPALPMPRGALVSGRPLVPTHRLTPQEMAALASLYGRQAQRALPAPVPLANRAPPNAETHSQLMELMQHGDLSNDRAFRLTFRQAVDHHFAGLLDARTVRQLQGRDQYNAFLGQMNARPEGHVHRERFRAAALEAMLSHVGRLERNQLDRVRAVVQAAPHDFLLEGLRRAMASRPASNR